MTVTGCFSPLIVMRPCKPGVKDQITKMVFNGTGIR
ncbi:TPA: hypothetical protein JZG35_005213 [Escherichia coli]|nr:hypothetical protein [Escherichia coli]HAX5174107.1 hypothetical protein [Escherichia coli]HAX5298332.1 hypothetical protein [Escherichia coli]